MLPMSARLPRVLRPLLRHAAQAAGEDTTGARRGRRQDVKIAALPQRGAAMRAA